MKKALIAAAVIAVFAAVLIQTGFVDGFRRGAAQAKSISEFEKAYAVSFRSTFITSCVGPDAPEVKMKICECSADGALAQLTVKQLDDQKTAIEYIKTNVLPRCIEKYKQP